MRLLRFLKFMGFLTLVSLIYIHLQMRIFDLAYQGKTKEKAIRELNDQNSQLTYEILKLKSSQNLGGKLLTESSDLRFLDQSQIVRVPITQLSKAVPKEVLPQEARQKSNFLANFFPLRSQAEAGR